jgi:hypothetical protein
MLYDPLLWVECLSCSIWVLMTISCLICAWNHVLFIWGQRSFYHHECLAYMLSCGEVWDMGTPGYPLTRLTTVLDKWVQPTRRLADLLVGPTDLVGSPTSWRPSRRFPRRPNSARPQDLAYMTRHRWISTKADRQDMASDVINYN